MVEVWWPAMVRAALTSTLRAQRGAALLSGLGHSREHRDGAMQMGAISNAVGRRQGPTKRGQGRPADPHCVSHFSVDECPRLMASRKSWAANDGPQMAAEIAGLSRLHCGVMFESLTNLA